MLKYIILLLPMLLSGTILFSQTKQQDKESKKPTVSKTIGEVDTIPASPERLIIENRGRRVVEVTDSSQTQYFYENVRAVQDSTYFFSDSAILTNKYLIAQSNVVILQDDTIRLFADSLFYSIDSSQVELFDSVIFYNGEQSLATRNSILYDLASKVAIYQDTAILSRGESRLQSVKGRYDVDGKISYFYEEVLVEDGDLMMRTDSMLFFTEENKIVFIAPTRIRTKDADLYCEEGFYNLETKEGEFMVNAQYVSQNRIVTGEKLIFNKEENRVRVEGESNFLTEGGRGNAEEIEYFEDNGDLLLLGDAEYITDDRFLAGVMISYNEKSGELVIAGNGNMKEGNTVIDGENIEYNDQNGVGLVEGNVVWTDTINKTTVRSDVLNINTLLNASRAYNYQGKPEIEILVDNDSLYMASDTLYSFELMDTLGNKKQFVIGDGRVKILKSDLQAVADSSVFFVSDSIYSLYQSPVMWSDSTQFTADTIHLYLKNRKIYKMRMINNAMVINTTDGSFFNQIKGRTITAFFSESELDNFVVDGNAQSVYYVLDKDGAYVGVNTTECSKLKFYFGDNEISDIKGYIEVRQKMIPFAKADHRALQLEGYKWMIDSKPNNRKDLQL